MSKWVGLILLFLTACDEAGNLNHQCKPDATCNYPNLVCNGGYCQMPQPPKTCDSDADCFCEQCLKRCGNAGLKRCEFTDPTVWGSKPTVCECRTDIAK